MEAHRVEMENPFGRAYAAFGRLVEELQSDEALGMTHSEAESLIDGRGREVMRQLYQDHIDLRGRGDVGPRVVGSDGAVRERKRESSRTLATIFGLVVVTRLLYSERGGGASALAPLDASLNLPKERYSHGLRERVARMVGRGAYDVAVDEVRRRTGGSVPKRQAEALAVQASVDFDEFYAGRKHAVDEAAAGGLLVLTVDGKGVVMRHKDLRSATRVAAERETHKLKQRLTKGEKANRKRMAMVASVYAVDEHPRTPESIVRGLQREAPPGKRPRPTQKRVWASVAKEPEAVLREVFAEAARRDPRREKRWVAVVDGNKTQIRLLRKFAKEYEVELTIVLDVIHVIEYLWGAARVFHAETDPAGEKWVGERLLRVLRGEASQVAAGIRRSATKRGFETAARKAADKAANYLLKYSDYLGYDAYLTDGLPIASGVIEGACRYLVKDRMDITGARWSLQGAEAVLRLRALLASGDFDAYWRFHLDREQAANHDVEYAGERPPRPLSSGRRRPDLRLVVP